MNDGTSGGRGPFVPTFDGKGSPFQDFEQRVALWNRTADIPADRRASQLVLHMEPFARQGIPVWKVSLRPKFCKY